MDCAAEKMQRQAPGIHGAMDAELHHDRDQHQRPEEIAHERHDVGIEVLRGNEREDVQQGEQHARHTDPENAAQIGRKREPAVLKRRNHTATMSYRLQPVEP